MLLAGVYVFVLFGAIVAVSSNGGLSAWGWALLPLPALPFSFAVVDAARLHRTADPARTRSLWRRCLATTALGITLLFVIAIVLGRMS